MYKKVCKLSDDSQISVAGTKHDPGKQSPRVQAESRRDITESLGSPDRRFAAAAGRQTLTVSQQGLLLSSAPGRGPATPQEGDRVGIPSPAFWSPSGGRWVLRLPVSPSEL